MRKRSENFLEKTHRKPRKKGAASFVANVGIQEKHFLEKTQPAAQPAAQPTGQQAWELWGRETLVEQFAASCAPTSPGAEARLVSIDRHMQMGLSEANWLESCQRKLFSTRPYMSESHFLKGVTFKGEFF